MSIAIISDTHFGVRNDSPVFYEYMNKFFDEVFWPYCEEHKIWRIIHLGDVFDRRKFINFRTLENFRRNIIDRISDKYRIEFILGNHDIFYKNTKELNSVNVLLKDYAHQTNRILIEDTPKVTQLNDKITLGFVPWLNSSDELPKTIDTFKRSGVDIILGHFEFSGFNMGGCINTSGINPSILKDFRLVLSGHYHNKQSNDNIYYVGSPFQFTWNDYGNVKGFHVLDDNGNLSFIENPTNLFKVLEYDDSASNNIEILNKDLSEYGGYYVKVVVKNKINPFVFDTFMVNLNKVNPQEIKIIEKSELAELSNGDIIIDESRSTIDLLKDVVDELNLENNEDIMKVVLKLYNEANYME